MPLQLIDTGDAEEGDPRTRALGFIAGSFLTRFGEVELATMRLTTPHVLGQTTGGALVACVSHRHRGGTDYFGGGVELT
jgi:hypothetical protein